MIHTPLASIAELQDHADYMKCQSDVRSNCFTVLRLRVSTDLLSLEADPKTTLISIRGRATSKDVALSTSVYSPSPTALESRASEGSAGSSNSFNPWAKVGIGAGFGLLIVLTAIGTFIISRRRRKQHASDDENRGTPDDHATQIENDLEVRAKSLSVQGQDHYKCNNSNASKRSSRSRANSNLPTVSEETIDVTPVNMGGRPELHPKQAALERPHSADSILAVPTVESSGGPMGRLRGNAADFEAVSTSSGPSSGAPLLRKARSGPVSPEQDHFEDEPVSREAHFGRRSPEKVRVWDSMPRKTGLERAPSHFSLQMDLGEASYALPVAPLGMGTTTVSIADSDLLRGIDSTWQTFFDPTPNATALTQERSLVPKHRDVDRGNPHQELTTLSAGSKSLELRRTTKGPQRPLTADEEYELLMMQRASIEDRKLRLLQLHQLDDDLARVNMEIKKRESQRRRWTTTAG